MTALQQKALTDLENEYDRKMDELEAKLEALEREREIIERWFSTKLESLEKEWSK